MFWFDQARSWLDVLLLSFLPIVFLFVRSFVRSSIMLLLMLGILEPVANAGKGTFLTLFIVLFDPVTGTNGFGRVPHRFAFGFIGIHTAQKPFIVQIPAPHGLVG
jgi:hypothetical protein